MTKLTRLKINKFRNVEPVELKFSRGLNVLLGINGSGKTTLLELIAALLSQNFSRFNDDSFSVEYDLHIDEGVLAVCLENSPVRRDYAEEPRARAQRHARAEYALQASVRFTLPSLSAQYLVEANRKTTTVTPFEGSGSRGKTTVVDTAPGFEERFLDRSVGAFLDVVESDDCISHASLQELAWLRSLSRFDESLGFFNDILDDDGWLNAFTDSTTGPAELNFDYDNAVGFSLIGAIDAVAQNQWSSWRGSETLTVQMKDLPFLLEMANLANFKHAKLELRLASKKAHTSEDADITTFSFGMFRFWFEKIDGTIIPEQKLSYGQKRLLAFLYYLDCNPDVIVADELAGGLHHAWITACIDAIGERQAFLASQDPLLIDELELTSVEDVERSFILCRCDTSSGKERLIWSNMTTYDAERFFEAYNVGLQHVSEILRTKRLW